MDIREFKATLKKVKQPRNHKVTGSKGVYDAYKWIRKNKWPNLERPLTEGEFYSIIRRVNQLMAEKLSSGDEIVFPERMGKVELRKRIPTIGFKDGKLKVTLSIDWDATLQLWYEDKEAYDNKQLVRIPEKQVFRYLYNKQDANYQNKSYFEFSVNRQIKQNIKTQIKQGNIDAFLRYD